MFHSKIKLAAEYSKEEVNVLDVNIKLIEGELKTDLFLKPADAHQFLGPISFYRYHCKKEVSCSQTLRPTGIYLDNEHFVIIKGSHGS